MEPAVPEWLQEVRQAEHFFDQKRFDEAAELAARALRRNPNAALAHQVQALVYVEIATGALYAKLPTTGV